MMFDLIADPLELTNLAPSGEHRDILAELTSIIEARYDLDELPGQVVASQRTRRFIDNALAQGKPQPWDFRAQPQTDPWFVRRGDAFPDVERRGYLKYDPE
ncbi:MAG TPA: hypothetical protein VMY41_06945 [Thermohalobaculum sp.]|nr:hypothetical protein [Thermohalobaculum sp.]